MDEEIDVVNTKGLPTGKSCLKSEAHQKGILHASVHVWLYTDNKEILVQKRSKEKDIYPNLWDVSVAGHITAGENHLLAAQREVLEEIGLNISKDKMNYQGIWEEKHLHSNGWIDHEIHHLYFVKFNGDLEVLKLQEEEVEEVKLISVLNFESLCGDKKLYVPHHPDYYKHIINSLNKIYNEK